MKITYFGLPLGALVLHGDGHEVRAIVRQPGALGLRRLRRRMPVELRAELDEPFIASIHADLIVSWFWTRRLPRAVLDRAPAIGVHPSLLPRWRGPDPTFWAIASGDATTGVTAHVLHDAYDTGPILGQRTLALDPTWNAWTLARKLDRPSLALLRDVVSRFAMGSPPPGRTQNEAEATEAPTPDEGMLEIRWSRPAADIERLVRAAAPWPGAFTEIGGKTVVLTSVRVAKPPAGLSPGQAWVRNGIAVVQAEDHGIELLEGRFEEEDRPLDALALAGLARQARLASTP